MQYYASVFATLLFVGHGLPSIGARINVMDPFNGGFSRPFHCCLEGFARGHCPGDNTARRDVTFGTNFLPPLPSPSSLSLLPPSPSDLIQRPMVRSLRRALRSVTRSPRAPLSALLWHSFIFCVGDVRVDISRS